MLRLEERAARCRDRAGPARTGRASGTREKAEVQEELEKGNRFALEERYVEALFHYRRALELYPDYSQARYNMARVLARMGEREMARDGYQRLSRRRPFPQPWPARPRRRSANSMPGAGQS